MNSRRYGLWTQGAEKHYARTLASRSAAANGKQIRDERRNASSWLRNEKTCHFVLATAYSLQPATWIVLAGSAQ
jgi:hypothetical protein